MQPALTLYHYWRSSCSWRVRWALALKGVSYESVPVNLLKGEQRAPDYLKRNPAGFVPALAVGDQVFGESLALIEYIDEAWRDPPLYPKDPLDRLRVRQLALTIVSGTQPLQNLVAMKRHSEDEAEKKAWAQHFIRQGLATYETLLGMGKPGKYSCGDQVTVADLCLVPQCYNAQRFEVDLGPFPKLAGINERLLATAACEKAHPKNQPGAQP